MKKMSHYFLTTTEGQFLGAIGLVIVLLLGYYFYAMSSNPSSGGTGQLVTITQTDHVRGAKDGKVTLVEFGDFLCETFDMGVGQDARQHAGLLHLLIEHDPHRAVVPRERSAVFGQHIGQHAVEASAS